MSAAPGLETLFELNAIFDRGSEAAPDEFLARTLPEIAARIPNCRFVRLYALADQVIILRAATDYDLPQDFQVRLPDYPIYARALQTTLPVYDAEKNIHALPLLPGGNPLGLLEIGWADEPPQGQFATWLQLLGEHFAQVYKTVLLRDLIERQNRASVQLTRSRTFDEMAGAIASNMVSYGGQFITINLAENNPDGSFARLRVVASANRRESFVVNATLDLASNSSWGNLYASFESNELSIVNHIAQDEDISQDVRDWLAGFGIVSVCSLPLRSQDQTFGFLGINDQRGAIALGQEEFQVYQQLADQVSALVQIYNLAEESTLSRQVSDHQAKAFGELRTGQSYVEMAGIIARHMLPVRGQALSLNKLIYDEQDRMTDWQVMATANRNQAFAWEGEVEVGRDDFAPELRQSVMDGVPYVINDIHTVSDQTIGAGFMAWIQKYRFQVLLNIPVMVDRRPIACLCVFSRTARPFTNEEVNALRNLADQIGILIHTGTLLEEAESARSVANDLVLANRLVKAAETYDDMAKAVIYTLGNSLTAAGIILFDQPLADEQGPAPKYRSLVALVTAEGEASPTTTMPIDPMPAGVHLESLRQGMPVIIPDIYQDTRLLTPGMRQRFAAYDLTWGAVFGLRAGDQLIGSLIVLHTEPYHLKTEAVDAFTTLADQIGLTLQGRQLLHTSREAQSLANQLVQTNRQITQANTQEDLVMALIELMPQNVTGLSLALFDAPLQSDELPEYLRFDMMATRAGITELRVTEYMTNIQQADVHFALERLRNGEIIHIPDIRRYQALLTPNFLARLRETTVNSIMTLGLRVSNRLLGLMTIMSDQTLTTDQSQLDNFHVIADQIAITLENRSLLTQTALALKSLQDQYNVAGVVHEDDDPVAILTAIHNFIEPQYKYSRLGVINTKVSRTVVHITAENDNGNVRAANRYVPLNSFPAWDTLSALETLYIYDISQDSFLNQAERELLRRQDIQGYLIVPLVASQQLLGLVVFSNPAPLALFPNQLRALRNLGDQLAIVLENAALLRSTAQTLEETRILYEATRSILATQDTMDVLRTLRQYLAPEATLINHFTVTTIGRRVENIVVDYVSALDDERVVQVSLQQMMGEKDFADLSEDLAKTTQVLDIVEDLQADKNVHLLRDFAALNGFRCYVHFIIWEHGVIREMVAVNFNTPQVFDESQRRLFRAVADQISIVLQNHRLLRETQVSATQLSGRVETLQTLNAIFSATQTSQDEKSLLDMIVTALTDLLKIDHAAIVLLDSSEVTGTVVSEYPEHGAVGVQFNMLTNPLHLVMKKNDFQPVVIDDVSTYPGLDEQGRETLVGLGVRAMLLIAIITQGKVVGTVGLDIYAPRRRFTPEMVNIAQTVVLQAGTSLQNLRLLQDTQRRAEQLQHITEFSQVAQVVLDVNAILGQALQASSGIMPYDTLRVALYDAETAKLRVVASRVNDQIEVQLTGGEQIPISGHLATVWETRDALHIPDLYAYPRDPQVDPRSRDWMVVPMIIQGRVTGMVSVGSTQSHQYSQTDVTVFQQFVNQLAGAIESAQAYNQSLRQAENESLINEISTNLQRQPDIQGMLDVTVQELGKALGARHARIRLTADEPGNKQE